MLTVNKRYQVARLDGTIVRGIFYWKGSQKLLLLSLGFKTLIMPQVAQARTMTLREFSACKNVYIAQWANCKDLNGKEQSQPKARSE